VIEVSLNEGGVMDDWWDDIVEKTMYASDFIPEIL
jgi:hypothetical protein